MLPIWSTGGTDHLDECSDVIPPTVQWDGLGVVFVVESLTTRR